MVEPLHVDLKEETLKYLQDKINLLQDKFNLLQDRISLIESQFNTAINNLMNRLVPLEIFIRDVIESTRQRTTKPSSPISPAPYSLKKEVK